MIERAYIAYKLEYRANEVTLRQTGIEEDTRHACEEQVHKHGQTKDEYVVLEVIQTMYGEY